MIRLVLAFVGRAIDRAFAKPAGFEFRSAWPPDSPAAVAAPPSVPQRGLSSRRRAVSPPGATAGRRLP